MKTERVSEETNEIQRTRESQRSRLKRLKELGDTNNFFFRTEKNSSCPNSIFFSYTFL